MSKYTTFNVAVQAEQMRAAQKLYFDLIARAKKSKLPADFAAAATALKVSKQVEQAFDETIREILHGKEEIPCFT
jgi:hypothetical protein